MSPKQKLAGFAVVLVATFGIGWTVGAAVDPIVEPEPAPAHEHTSPFGGHGG